MVSRCCDKKISTVCLLGMVVLLAFTPVRGWSFQIADENAALIYYQAALFRSGITAPEDSYYTGTLFRSSFDFTPALKAFVRSADYQTTLELITAASKMEECDWGFSLTTYWQMQARVPGVRGLQDIPAMQARLHADERQYAAALENAITLRRLSRHFGDFDEGMRSASDVANFQSCLAIQYTLDRMPPDAEILTWLNEKFAAGDLTWNPREMFTRWRDQEVKDLQTHPGRLDERVGQFRAYIDDPAAKQELANLTSNQILERALRRYNMFLEAVLTVLDSDMLAHLKYRAIEKLESEAFDAASEEGARAGNPLFLLDNEIGLPKAYYRVYMNTQAYNDAIQAALAIYLSKATTGKLPETLPTGLPRDPYSDEDFEYRVMDGGFILRCHTPAIDLTGEDPDEIRQFEFKVSD